MTQKHRKPRLQGTKWFLKRLLCNTTVGRVVGFLFGDRIPYCGVRIHTRSLAVPAKNKAAMLFGVYESAERRFIQQYLDSQVNVIELGSSLGGVSSHIARKLAKSQQLICVEASPQMTPVLEKNLAQNAAHLNTTLVHGAVAYGDQTVKFNVAENPLDSSVRSDGGENSVTVPSVQLGSLVHQLEEDSYQLVSDIEGAELAIVVHDRPALQKCKLAIVEFHEVVDPAWSMESIEAAWLDTGFQLIDKFGSVCVMQRVSEATSK